VTIEFSKTGAQRIAYARTLAPVYNLTQKTIAFRINFDNIAMVVGDEWIRILTLYDDTAPPYTDSAFALLMGVAQNGDLVFSEQFDDTPGSWKTNNAIFTVGVNHTVVITYDNSNVANNPIIYADGISVPITEIDTPVGAVPAGVQAKFSIGGLAWVGVGDGTSIDGKMWTPYIYDRIFTAQEALIFHESRIKNVIRYGLVFGPELDGAAGLTIFDGATLAAGNTIADPISGIVGVPTGNPVGRGNTITNIGIGVQ